MAKDLLVLPELLCSHLPITKAAFFLQRKWLDFSSASPHQQQEACETSQNSPVELGTEQACSKAQSGLRMLQPSLLGCPLPRPLRSAAHRAGPCAGDAFGRALTVER